MHNRHHVAKEGIAVESILPNLRSIPMLHELDSAEFTKLSTITLMQTSPRKSNVFTEGEPRTAVYFICQGIIKVYKVDPNGNEQIVSYLKKGEMFPHTGFFDPSPYPATTEVVETVELLVIPIKAFEQLMLDTPSIAIKVMRVMGAKIRELQAKLQDFVVHDVNRRIISVLLRLADEHGIEEKGQRIISLAVTQQDIASMAGTTRETVSRLFQHLRKDRLIEMDRKQIVILDFDLLQSY